MIKTNISNPLCYLTVQLNRNGLQRGGKGYGYSSRCKERWEQIQDDDERILFIVGGPGSGKSLLIRELSEQKGWKYFRSQNNLLKKSFYWYLVMKDHNLQKK